MLAEKKNSYIYYSIIGLLFLLFLLRVINLECDLPGFGITFYQPIDEGLYSRAAINYIKYEDFNYADNYVMEINPVFKSNIIQTLLQIATFKIFGNTYYGLRIPSVIIALMIYLLIYRSLTLITKKYKLERLYSRKIILIMLVCVLCDFTFLTLSRSVENSNVRALSSILTVYLFIKLEKREFIKYVILGFMSVVSIFLIYYSNVHILAAVGLLGIFALIRKDWKKFKTMFAGCLLGAAIGSILSEVYYRLAWGTGAIMNFIEGVSSFADRGSVDSTQTNMLITWIKNGLIFFDSNMFFFNILFLGVSLIAFIFNLYSAFKKRDELKLFIAFLICAVMLQSIFFHDWMERKAIIIYPILILNIVLFIMDKKEIKVKDKTLLYYRAIFFIGMLFISYTMVRFRKSYSYFKDFEEIDLCLVLGVIVFQLLILGYIVMILHHKQKVIKRINILLGIGMAASLTVNIFFSFKYVYNYNFYTEKEAMQGIGVSVGENFVLGPYAYGFSLYNNIKPISTNMETYKEYIECSDVNYIIDYSDGAFYAENILPSQESKTLVDSFDRSISIYGEHRKIGVFKKDLGED